MSNKKGFTGLEIVGVIAAVGLVVMLMPKLNLFDNSADPSNRRTASAISGKDIVKITNQVAEADQPVTVTIDRSVVATAEVTDPKLTVGQRIGRFFSGLGTWSVIGIFVAVFVLGISPSALLAWSRHTWKAAFKNTVAGIRSIDDPEAYKKATTSIAVQQNKRDKKLVDVVKAELH